LAIAPGWYASLLQPNELGIALGLLVGKPVGITVFSWLGVKARIMALPDDMTWKHIGSVSVLGGVGFTMSIFITLLAFQNPLVVQQSKIVILIASLIAGCTGYVLLRCVLRTRPGG